VECVCECDRGLLKSNRLHQVLFIADGGPKVMTVMIDGVLCDGGAERRFGWSRFHTHLLGPNGAPEAILVPGLHGKLHRLRIYNRYLLSSEGVGNWKAAGIAK
ncbi:MAG: hypothetical protein HQL31_13670, partial [Planctomycetes bacterium]|nr:hypothetical protein [Planctomycetota bacterium]